MSLTKLPENWHGAPHPTRAAKGMGVGDLFLSCIPIPVLSGMDHVRCIVEQKWNNEIFFPWKSGINTLSQC